MIEQELVENSSSCEPYIDFALTDGDVPIPELDIFPTVRAVEDVHNFYTSPQLPEGTLNERLKKRNAAIRSLFAKFSDARKPELTIHITSVRFELSCKNSGGGLKKCPGSHSFGADYTVFEVLDSERHMKTRAHKANDFTIAWVIGRTGEGKNTGWVSAKARLSPTGSKRRLDEDVSTLRAELRRRNLPDDRAIDPV